MDYLGSVKAFADGSLGSSSALVYEPYVNEAQNCGLQVTDTEKLLNLTLASDKCGLQVAVRAIGDKANDLILDVFNSVNSANGVRDRRFRIEHAQHLASGTVNRFASVQPDHLLDDADSDVKKLGKDRADKGSYLFRSLLERKTTVAFGSDRPVADVNPLGSIRMAMKRTPPGSEHAWIPSEHLPVFTPCSLKPGTSSILVYTISAARAVFLDKDLGSISPGKLADFIVSSTDSWNHLAARRVGKCWLDIYVAGFQAYP